MIFKARPIPFKRLLKFALLCVATVGLSIAVASPSLAQFVWPDGISQSNAIGPPPSVTRYGNIETIVVRSPVSNRALFNIASPTVYNRSELQADQQTVEQRAKEIQARILIVLKREMDPDSLMFGVSQLNNVTVISVRDDQYTRPFILSSITTHDADFNGLPEDDLAEEWLDIIEDDLRNGLMNLPRDRERVNKVLAVLFAISGITLFLKYGLRKRQKTLRKRKKAIDESSSTSATDKESPDAQTASLHEQVTQKRVNVIQQLQQDFTVERRLVILDAVQWLLFWLTITAWYGGFAWIFAISPYLLVDSLSFLEMLLSLLTIWFITGLSIRVSRRLIDYLSIEREGLDIGDFLTFGDTQRRQIRASTIAGAAKGLITVLIALIGLLSALSALGVSTASVVAIGSLVGLAITFGSQNLVKDLVNGFFILAEDQYAIGDVIDTGTAVGLVETLNMRVTQIRSPDGELITIPNSSITQVKNLTRSWSRVAFTLDVAYDADPDNALDVLREVSKSFYDDPQWHDTMAAEPNVLGIDRISHSGISITIWIETEPAQQWAVGREFRLRVRRALAEHGIEIGIPQQTYRLNPEPSDDYALHQRA